MKIRNFLDLVGMRRTFEATSDHLMSLGTITTVGGRNHSFIDRGASILGIAHLDVVCNLSHFHYVDDIAGSEVILSSVADDRLGVYTLLHLLPQLGVKCDVLLTTDEEQGKSTAANFKPTKEYNWMFMFDRRGDDVVTYMYNSAEWKKALAEKFTVGHGSASCISKMESLGVSAVNVGCGYHDEHDPMCYIRLDEYTKQVGKFVSFYHKNKHTPFPHVKPTTPTYSWKGNGYTGYGARGDIYEYDDADVTTPWWRRPGSDTVTKPTVPITPAPLPGQVNQRAGFKDWEQYIGKPWPTHCVVCNTMFGNTAVRDTYCACCQDCEDLYIPCEYCGEYHDINSNGIHYVEADGCEAWACVGCIRGNFVQIVCVDCEELTDVKDVNQDLQCKSCAGTG